MNHPKLTVGLLKSWIVHFFKGEVFIPDKLTLDFAFEKLLKTSLDETVSSKTSKAIFSEVISSTSVEIFKLNYDEQSKTLDSKLKKAGKIFFIVKKLCRHNFCTNFFFFYIF